MARALLGGGWGRTVWDSIVYDPKLDLVYAGTGNGSTWYRDLRSPGGGDNLYLASILALRASDGQLVWHYQVTPQENWDYDATQPLMLADLNIGGAPRKVIMQASKNGSSTCSIAKPASSFPRNRSSTESTGPPESIPGADGQSSPQPRMTGLTRYLFPRARWCA